MLMVTSQIFAGNVYYVDCITGNDLNNGLTLAIAWKTIKKANTTLTAGDTVYIRGGIYSDNDQNAIINPRNSGTSGNPITYTNYQTDTVILRSITDSGLTRGASIGKNYITIDGLTFDNVSQSQSYMEFFVNIWANKNHVIIQNCTMQHADSSITWEMGIRIGNGCTYCEIKNNTIRHVGISGSDVGDGIKFQESGTTCTSKYNLIEGNTIEYCGHSCLVLQGGYNVIKNNTFYSPWEKCIDIIGNQDNGATPQYNLLTGNKFYDAGSGESYHYSGIQNCGLYNIIRRNRFYGSNGAGLICFGRIPRPATYNHIYNNVFYDNGKGDTAVNKTGIKFHEQTGADQVAINNVIKNNINYNNNDTGVTYVNCSAGEQIFAGNHWDADGNPIFTNASNADFTLQSDSPCIDAGSWLTYTDGSGDASCILTVENARYFIDGFGVVEGDSIQLEGQTQTARIIGVDYNTNIIALDTPLTWYSGQGVSLAYSGSAPDIGAYEYSNANPLNATINASPTSGQVPLTISFTGNATGGSSPYTYSWNFGDGTSSSTQNPSHTYSTAGDYTATLTVTDSASSQDSESVTINASTPPSPLVASLVASPTSGQVPLSVNFTGGAIGGSPPYTYSWNFGDGVSSSSQNPSHTYSTAGNYTATLTVTDNASNQDIESVTISTSAPPLHTVTTPNTPSGPTNGFPNVSYAYTTGGSSCSQGHSIEYRFDWGDGTYSAWSSSTIASHSWPAAGSYTVKAQARCSINHSIVSGWSPEKIVTIATSSYYNLALSSATGSPTPGQGGTTDPSPGNHSYPSGNSVLVSAITNTDYRFSKWTGDVSSSDTYNEEITLSMDNNKSISAYFCTKCGDVNGDLNISPADAQEVFEIFLGIISDPTDCQKENADVNCDGTKTDPKITPGDAQAIFEKFLGINDLPGDCSCKSRAESAGTLAIQERAFVQLERSANINLIINDIQLKPGTIIAVPVIIDNPFNIKAFGFDILFESEILEFVGVVRTELLKDFNEVDGNEISQGVLRVGGYSSEPIRSHSPGALIRLIFKVTGETEEPCPFLITNTVDDLENASFQNRTYMRKKIRRKEIVF